MRTESRILGRLTRAFVGLGLVAAGVAATGGDALADAKPVPGRMTANHPAAPVPAGFADWDRVWAYQARLNAAAEQILAAGGAGNASIVADPTNHELRVFWHGAVPASVRTTAGRLGVPVRFHPAAFTHRELATEAKRLVETAPVIGAAPAVDGSGLDVTVEAALAPAARSSLRVESRVALSIKTGTRNQATADRQHDTPQFWGGSRYVSVVGECTNGVPVRTGSVTSMMTAGHCGALGGSVTIPGQASPTGTVISHSTCRDTALISYPAGISPAIYTGPFDASTTNNAILASPTPDFVGNLIVTDGASSGEHFNIRVGAVDAFQSVGGIPCAATGPLTVANSLDNTCAQAPGDSGGPVYSYLNGAAQMRGTITGGNSGVACPGEVSTGGFQVIYAPLVRPNGDAQVGSLSVHGVSVMGVPVFDLNGTYADGPGRGPGPVISVQLSNITVDMSRFQRPTAHGVVVDENNISVTFPDDRTYTGQLLTSGVILWSNGTEWIKL